MPRIVATDWRTLRCIFQHDGYTFKKRTDGSHWAGEKDGVARPLILPAYAEVRIPIIMGLMRTANMSRERYFVLLALC